VFGHRRCRRPDRHRGKEHDDAEADDDAARRRSGGRRFRSIFAFSLFIGSRFIAADHSGRGAAARNHHLLTE